METLDIKKIAFYFPPEKKETKLITMYIKTVTGFNFKISCRYGNGHFVLEKFPLKMSVKSTMLSSQADTIELQEHEYIIIFDE